MFDWISFSVHAQGRTLARVYAGSSVKLDRSQQVVDRSRYPDVRVVGVAHNASFDKTSLSAHSLPTRVSAESYHTSGAMALSARGSSGAEAIFCEPRNLLSIGRLQNSGIDGFTSDYHNRDRRGTNYVRSIRNREIELGGSKGWSYRRKATGSRKSGCEIKFRRLEQQLILVEVVCRAIDGQSVGPGVECLLPIRCPHTVSQGHLLLRAQVGFDMVDHGHQRRHRRKEHYRGWVLGRRRRGWVVMEKDVSSAVLKSSVDSSIEAGEIQRRGFRFLCFLLMRLLGFAVCPSHVPRSILCVSSPFWSRARGR